MFTANVLKKRKSEMMIPQTNPGTPPPVPRSSAVAIWNATIAHGIAPAKQP